MNSFESDGRPKGREEFANVYVRENVSLQGHISSRSRPPDENSTEDVNNVVRQIINAVLQ